VVTVTSGTAPHSSTPQLGKKGKFGSITLYTVEDEADSGEGNFRMCFVEAGTNVPVTVKQFTWSVFDLDERGQENNNKMPIKEKIVMDIGQVKVYQIGAESGIVTSCEDGSVAPCPVGVRTIFHSYANGNDNDNPLDPNTMNTEQQKRSIAFTFANTSCWEFTFNHYCPVDQPGYNGSIDECRSYGEGIFLFAGDSEQIMEQEVCFTPPPTNAPSTQPTVTAEPTITTDDTESPTDSTSLPLPACPADVSLYSIDGSTEIDLEQAVHILSQDTTTVTVRLYQSWTSVDDVNSIYYTYRQTSFLESCFGAENVGPMTAYQDITMSCYHNQPVALLQICVADNDGALNNIGDTAEVPTCCGSVCSGCPAVCYKIIVWCDSLCDDESKERRDLRD
jgi:hypothetical protein